MNGHDEQGSAAYGPGDEIEIMAAILAAHDEAAEEWRIETWHPSPLCPICGWELIPVEDGRMICPDCGHEEGEPADAEAWAADAECPFCGALLIPGSPGATCPDCGAAFNAAAELAQADGLMAQGAHDDDDAPDPAVVLAELNRVRFTIEVHTDDIGRPCAWRRITSCAGRGRR